MLEIIFIIFLILCTFYDLREFRIPNRLTLGFYLLMLILIIISKPHILIHFLVSSIIGFLAMLIFVIATKGKLGMGDAKMCLTISGFLGIVPWFYSLFLASVLALSIAMGLLFLKKIKPVSPIPFAPFLATGALVIMFLPEEVFFAL